MRDCQFLSFLHRFDYNDFGYLLEAAYISYDIWYDMIWYDKIWYDLWYGMTWYDMTWYDMIWYMIWYDIRYYIWYDTIWYDMIYDMIYFVNCKWVDTRWQQYSTHLHTNNTQNNTMIQNIQNRTYITIRIHNLQN